MPARLFKPAKTAMQSGVARTQDWVLEFPRSEAPERDTLMGWSGSGDTQKQVRIGFASKEEALDYAKRVGLAVSVQEPKSRKHVIRPGGYGDNFASSRRQPWSH
ncbi:ETC complex I subunit [Halovulum sp. GXIMD14793]